MIKMTQLEKLLSVAAGEIGTKEAPANSNTVKYNTWYYGRVVGGTAYPWCSTFVTWCFHTAGLMDLAWGSLDAARRAVAEGARNWKVLGEKKKAWYSTLVYIPGDIVLFDWDKNGSIDHVGIVESVSADHKTITTIEGNTATGNDSNDGAVMRHQRSIGLTVG
ncbi:hypothetical protein FACS1894171_2490 [Clostridia bacterium]|nr:hypothetical protein FACS1894171_2490 [Clostridia bacterium]